MPGKTIQIQAYEAAIAEEKAAVVSLESATDIFDIKRVSCWKVLDYSIIVVSYLHKYNWSV